MLILTQRWARRVAQAPDKVHVTYNPITLPKVQIIKNTVWPHRSKITDDRNMDFNQM